MTPAVRAQTAASNTLWISLGTAALHKERLLVRARRVAEENDIDLPGAYSVVVGVMDLDRLQDLEAPSPTIDDPDPPAADPDPPADAAQGRPLRYDPGFRSAVKEGLLTSAEAFARGNREVLAAKLSNKHRLTRERAFAVADNRVSLLSAIREDRAGEDAAVEPIAAARPSGAVSIFGIALVGVLAIGLMSAFTAENGVDNVQVSGTDVRLLTNAGGQVVRIEGPDPISVLGAYCKSGDPQRELEPLGLLPTAAPQPDLAIGILRDRDAPDDRIAIYISRDRAGRRWTAGNGREPLVAFQAPE